MDYTVTHATRFLYENPVQESVMEVRLGPRNDASQEVQGFALETTPAAAVFRYTDAFDNDVHHFDIAPPHRELLVRTRMHVRTLPPRLLPASLEPTAWDTLARLRATGQLWDFFEPSPRVPVSSAVADFAAACGLVPATDPLTSFRHIVSAVHGALLYAPRSTTVDTPIETVLEQRRGVCQDFAHVALALARAQGIPCRYVSGYFAPTSQQAAEQNLTSHAWIEAWLPGLEWTALDPTHDLLAGEHHISVAVGRDYGDAAPTRGVLRGESAGTLSVAVQIEQNSGAASTDEMLYPPRAVAPPLQAVPQPEQ
jgi:transglutaminase-like putative cysteine protease